MFTASFFPKSYFAGDYFPPASDITILGLTAISLGTALGLLQVQATASLQAASYNYSFLLGQITSISSSSEETSEESHPFSLINGRLHTNVTYNRRGRMIVWHTMHGATLAVKTGTNQYRRL